MSAAKHTQVRRHRQGHRERVMRPRDFINLVSLVLAMAAYATVTWYAWGGNLT